MNKTFTLGLAVVLLVCFMAPCFASGGQSAAPAKTGIDPLLNATGLPIAKERVNLTFAACRPAFWTNGLSEMQIIQDYEKLTNVYINWIEIEEAIWNERVRLILASNDLPDAFWGWAIADNVVLSYGEQGILLPLENMIDTYAHNILKGMQVVPEIRPAITFPNGHIYALPMQNIGPQIAAQNFMWINNDWLGRAGLNMPGTTEELYNALKTFKSLYTNDQAFSFVMYTPAGIIDSGWSIGNMFGFWGVLDNDRHLMIDANSSLLFSPAQPGYLEGLRFFNRLYREGLLDPESFTQTQAQLQAKSRMGNGVGLTLSNMVNAHVDWSDRPQGYVEMLDDYHKARYEPLAPLTAPGGKAPVHAKHVGVQGANSGRFVITNVNKHPEISLRWVDLFCDNMEHSNNMRLGPQGMNWDFVDGNRTQLNPPVGNVEGVTYGPSHVSVWWWYPGAPQIFVPSILYHLDFVAEKYIPYVTLQPVPIVKFTSDESEKLSGIQVDLFRFVDSSLTNFIMNGVTDVQWNDYLTRLRSYGMETYVDMYKTAIIRGGVHVDTYW